MAYIGKSPTGTGVRQRYYFTATGGETSLSGTDDNGLTLSYSDGAYVDVLLNGIELVAGTDYNTSTANTIAGLSALAANDIVTVTVYDIFTVADTVSAKDGGTFSGNVNMNGDLDINGNDLILDADGDSKIEASTDDTVNIISGGTTGLTVDSSGRVLLPAKPSFKAYANDGWIGITTAGTDVVLPFDHTEHNVGSHYDTSTNKFTCPVDGLYVFTAQIYVNRGSGTSSRVIIKRVNNTTERLSFTNWDGMYDDQTIQTTVHYYATAGDEIQAFAYKSNVVANTDIYVKPDYSYFCGAFLG